ncbi:MAG: hypothetical protein VKL60_17755 [Sphaerospermopsis sp.]|nr:hypothetical protein [Sphaerospermopsis sp.]
MSYSDRSLVFSLNVRSQNTLVYAIAPSWLTAIALTLRLNIVILMVKVVILRLNIVILMVKVVTLRLNIVTLTVKVVILMVKV